jgi:hypothetical protein
VLKSIFDDFFERQKATKRSAIFKWRYFTKAANKEASSDSKEDMRKNANKMKMLVAKKFIRNRNIHFAKRVLHALSIEAKKSRM